MRQIFAPALLLAAWQLPALAQEGPLSPSVRAFVRVDDSVVALVHARVIDGTGSPALADQTVLLRDGLIAAVGDHGSVDVPPDARMVDLSGQTVIPGLIMLHEHMFYPAGQGAYNQQEYSFPRLYVAGGVTTLRTGGSRDPYGDLNLKQAIDEGRVPGPNVEVTGPYLNGPGMPILFLNELHGPDHARRMVAYWADEGATSFKTYMHISREELGAVVQEAHRRGLKVTGHLCSVTCQEAAALGIDNLEHGWFASTDFVPDKTPDTCPPGNARTASLLDTDPRGPGARALIDELVSRGVALTPTLTVFETYTPGRARAPDAVLDALSPDAGDRYLRTWSRTSLRDDSPWITLFPKGMAFERAFSEAGGLLVVGTDPTGYGGVVAGYANLRSIELLVEAGCTPAKAIQIATQNGARFLGIDDRVGTIRAGMVADLVVIHGDPATNIADIHQTEIVFKNGIGYDSRRLFDSVRGTVGVR